jgi:hypothetical protein
MSGGDLMAEDYRDGNSGEESFGRLRSGARSRFACAVQVVESQQRHAARI